MLQSLLESYHAVAVLGMDLRWSICTSLHEGAVL
eukprot:SAG31_NODE_31919_length_362_cov_0.961977_1_plen_33_part_01